MTCNLVSFLDAGQESKSMYDCIVLKKAHNAFFKVLQYILVTPVSQTHLPTDEKDSFQLFLFKVQDVARQAY